MKEKANYGNWVPEKALYMLFGAAALTIRCAKAFPKAQITAMDYWGVEWNYAKEQCEKNAKIESVAYRCEECKKIIIDYEQQEE